MNLGERGTLNATDQNRFCLHDSNDDRWSIGLQFVDRNIRRDVSLVEERNDRISKRLKEKKKNEIERNIGTTTTTTTATFRSVLERKRKIRSSPSGTQRSEDLLDATKKEICVLNFLFLPYLRQCGRGDGGRDFYAFESRVKFGLFSNQGKKN